VIVIQVPYRYTINNAVGTICTTRSHNAWNILPLKFVITDIMDIIVRGEKTGNTEEKFRCFMIRYILAIIEFISGYTIAIS